MLLKRFCHVFSFPDKNGTKIALDVSFHYIEKFAKLFEKPNFGA